MKLNLHASTVSRPMRKPPSCSSSSTSSSSSASCNSSLQGIALARNLRMPNAIVYCCMHVTIMLSCTYIHRLICRETYCLSLNLFGCCCVSITTSMCIAYRKRRLYSLAAAADNSKFQEVLIKFMLG